MKTIILALCLLFTCSVFSQTPDLKFVSTGAKVKTIDYLLLLSNISNRSLGNTYKPDEEIKQAELPNSFLSYDTLISRFDGNKDGKLQVNELVTSFSSGKNFLYIKRYPAVLFLLRYDLDYDGYISTKEMPINKTAVTNIERAPYHDKYDNENGNLFRDDKASVRSTQEIKKDNKLSISELANAFAEQKLAVSGLTLYEIVDAIQK